ncbi:hypothetical protein COY27_00760 [Candidatus Woesearchaeota archaeon CG_4_10_14_0_2_um_filter_33_13]|nr:MAG: hypothetical protein COY27_00760 [Candidatus Woesearchaeota archaeon CG_4_10_14_0_2_um_filter_33_13]
MVKKVMVSLSVLIMFIFLVGCLDYKAYDIPEDQVVDESNLVDEIAQLEKELTDESQNVDTTEVVEEEVVLPELSETLESESSEESLSEVDTITVKENDLVRLNAKVTDPDNDKVTYFFSKPLNKLGEWKTNYGDAGEYLVTLSATDEKLTTEKKIKIVVERVNVAPVVEGVRDIVVNEGATVNFEPKVSDPNGDAISVKISEPLGSGNFVTDHTSAGEYQITVETTDGELETIKTFKLIVNDVNVLPELTGLEDITVKEGETVKIEPKVSDLDGDEVLLTISDPVGNDGVWETSYTSHGVYVITVTANDGKDKVSKNIKVTVEDVNMAPEIIDVYLTN